MIEFLYDLLITLPISEFFTGIYALYLLPDDQRTDVLVLSAAISVFAVAFFRMKTKWKIVSGSAFLGLIVILICLGKGDGSFAYLTDYIWCGVVFVIVMLAVVFGRIMSQYVRFKGIFALLTIAYFIFSMVTHKNICKVDMISEGIIILSAVSELIQKYWNKEGYTDRKTHTVTIAPFFLVIFVIAAFIKVPSKPYDWKWFVDKGKAVKQGYIVVTQRVFKGDKEGFISVYGVFSDDGELHPDISQSKNRVMALKPENYAPSKLYIKGIVSDDFDGRSWTRKNNTDDTWERIDVAESLYSAEMFDSEHSRDYVRIDGATVRFTYFNTRIAFHPGKTLVVESGDPKMTYESREGSMFFDETEGYGSQYTVRYAIMNSESPFFNDFVNAEHPESKESFNKFTKTSFYTPIQDVDYDDLLSYRQYINDVYLPQTTISDKAENLLSEITKDCVTDYDKCKAIEGYLQGYEYTWHPGEYPKYASTPEGFLDYFLFENKQGYCAYYATAFVLMARSAGIPARYVEGYCVPTDKRNEVEVRGNMAHAWPEAYIEGVGWLKFEPTSGGNGAGTVLSYWATAAEKNAESEVRVHSMERQEEDSAPDLQDDDEEESFSESGKRKKSGWIFLIIPIVMAFLSLTIFTVAERAVMRKKYAEASGKERIRIVCKKNLQLLKVMGFSKEERETLTEYRNRLLTDLPSEILEFITVYEKLLYSADILSDEDEKIVHKNYADIFAQIKAKRGRFVYLVQKCLTTVM